MWIDDFPFLFQLLVHYLYKPDELAGNAGSSVASVRPDPFVQGLADAMWTSDTNRMRVQLDLQRKSDRNKLNQDNAVQPLIKSLNMADLQSKPTYAAFIKLLDNYYLDTTMKEVDTEEEKREIEDFLNLVVKTRVMGHLFEALVSKGYISNDIGQFKRLLRTLWFDHYKRSNVPDSTSGFEHVFVGEMDNRGKTQSFKGLHNWIQYYLLENRRQVDYMGYVIEKKLDLDGTSLIKYRSSMPNPKTAGQQMVKPVSSMFVGTSPEYEMGIYTACFMFTKGNDACQFSVGGTKIDVTVHRQQVRKPGAVPTQTVGTAFPDLARN